MGYEVVKIQNDIDKPTIIVAKGDKEWEEAFAKWLKGGNPTDSKEWKKGVFALSQVTSV